MFKFELIVVIKFPTPASGILTYDGRYLLWLVFVRFEFHDHEKHIQHDHGLFHSC